MVKLSRKEFATQSNTSVSELAGDYRKALSNLSP